MDTVATESNDAEIPDELKRLRQFVMWRFVERDGKLTKIPYQTNGGHASSTNPATWATFGEVLAAFERGGFDGIGFVFTEDDPYVGIDFDDCIDEQGRVAPEVLAVLETFDTYCEISPSRRGIKAWIRANLPDGSTGRNTTNVQGFAKLEVYDKGRYFAMTGNSAPCSSGTIRNCQREFDEFFERNFPTAEDKPIVETGVTSGDGFTGTDNELLQVARNAKNGGKFAALFDRGDTGEYDGDDSAADAGLCSIITFYCGDNADRIDSVFRRSALYRDKWDSKRGAQTYGEMTISKAIEHAKRNGGFFRRIAPVNSENIIEYPEPLRLAEHLVKHKFASFHGPTIRRFRDDWFRYLSAAYEPFPDESLTAAAYSHLDRLWTNVRDKDGEIKRDDNGDPVLRKIVPTKHLVNEVVSALPSRGLMVTGGAPQWLEVSDRPDPREMIACKNTLVHVPTRKTFLCTPRFFSMNALPFDFDPHAQSPRRWLQFLHDLYDDDTQSIQTLQEIFGYALTPNTKHQKIFLMVGPKRSGKGTQARVLMELLGRANVAAPTLAGLATNFGCQSLLNKPWATISDAQLSGRTDSAIVVERLLSISGEDAITIDRKNQPAITVTLPTRFLILTNELPKLTNASGALASRFIVLRLNRSFYGKEDHDLTAKLIEELPGIFLWALEGWDRLRERGRFVQPDAAKDEIEEIESLGAPVAAFVRECCTVHARDKDINCIAVKGLFDKWREWCKENGRDGHAGNIQMFGRDLRAAFPGIYTTQARDKQAKLDNSKDDRIRKFYGISYGK